MYFWRTCSSVSPWLRAYCSNSELARHSGESSRLPGQTELTRTPYSASSSARLWVRPMPPNLAGGVGRVLEAALLARLGVDLDDDAAALRLHDAGRLVGGEEVAEQVDVHHRPPLLRGELGRPPPAIRMPALETRMSSRPNSATVPAKPACDRRLVGHVHAHREGAPAGRLGRPAPRWPAPARS